jgi:Fe-S-cluster formation regulator IscX/YfhJ
MSVDEIAVDNLKTYLREGDERFRRLREEWSNAELLGRYFERIAQRLDEYFRDADPGRNLARAHLRLRYVLTRPVLDANEGDDDGRRYEEALLNAMARCGVDAADVTLVQEPVAAAVGIAKRRADELLALADGSAVAVVDSGGGTTHVALGRVRLRDGRVSLDLAGSYALRLADDNPALEALTALERHGFEGRREVGGNVLDNVLLFQLATQAERLLESDGRPIPSNIWLRAGERPKPAGSLAAQARVRDLRNIARRLKERFARASTQYLNRPPGVPRPTDEVLPFPHREELQGIYLVHALYDEQILAAVFDPVVMELCDRISRGAATNVRPSEVRRVFYVGGTNVDPFVRQHFGRMFPLAPGDDDAGSQSDARIQERMEAVVDGAVWFDEQLYAPSPLSLSIRAKGEEVNLVLEGAPLLPAGIAAPRFFVERLDPGAELEATLVAAGSGLDEPVEVARALFRNDEAQSREVALSILVSREWGCVAELQWGSERLPQWRFALAGGER